MSVTLKKDSWKIKDGNGTYRDSAIFSTTLPEDAAAIVAEATSAIDAQQIRATDIVGTATSEIDTIVQRVNDLVDTGTDTTLTQAGAAADAKAAGDKIGALSEYVPVDVSGLEAQGLYINGNKLTTITPARLIVIPATGVKEFKITCSVSSTKRIGFVDSVANNATVYDAVEYTGTLNATAVNTGNHAYLVIQLFVNSDAEQTVSTYLAGMTVGKITAVDSVARAVCEDVPKLKSFVSNVDDLLGNVEYWGTPSVYTPTDARRISMSQVGNRLTLNNTEPTAETSSITQRIYRLNDGIDFQTTSDAGSDTFRLLLVEGHKYRLIAKKISGSVTFSTDGGAMNVFIRETGGSTTGEGSPALLALRELTDEMSADFTAGSSNVNILLRVSNGILCTDYVIEVFLLDLTEAQKLINSDAFPTENSGNLVLSGGVYSFVKSTDDYLTETNINGTIAYGVPDGSYTYSTMSVSQKGNLITFNGTSSASSSQSSTKVLICDHVLIWNASATPSDALVYPIKLINGHKYKLSMAVKSGTREAGESTGSVGLRLVDADDNPISLSLPIEETYAETVFYSDGTPLSLRFLWARTAILTDFVVEVLLRDVTVESKLNTTYDVPIDWAYTFGDDDYPLGWQKGVYNATGETNSSGMYMRTNRRMYYTAKTGDAEISFAVPDGYHAAIVEYDENGANGTRTGHPDSSVNSITIPVTVGHRYKFCVGKWPDADSTDYITDEFISTMTAVVKHSFEERQREQDERINDLLGNGIPEYYTTSNYLKDKIDTITNLQKTLSGKTDSFIFVTDYHTRTNQGNSLALIREVASKTGIQKIFYSGDAGGRLGTTASGYTLAMQKSAKVWSDLAACAEEFYGTLGNHEWIDSSVFPIGAMFSNYLNRYKHKVKEMSEKGSYYIEDPVCKIRYYFIQDSYGASALDYDWLGKTLEIIDDGWYVAVIVHHGYIPGRASMPEYDGIYIPHSDTVDGEGNPDTMSASHIIAKVVSHILDSYQSHTTYSARLSGVDYSWDFTGSSGGGAIGVFCGHYHHGTLFAIGDEYNEYNVTVWRGGTDSMQAGSVMEEVDGNKVPWYWENGVIGGTKIIRASGTTDEQCFYVVQIDMGTKTVHITAFGGDHDWEFTFA